MTDRKSATAFYLETVIMIIIFVLIILVLTRAFGEAKLESTEAARLTNAVCLAQNAAEALEASDDENELMDLLNEAENASWNEGSPVTSLRVFYDRDMNPSAEGDTWMDVTWEPDERDAGTFVKSSITVYDSLHKEPVYHIDTGVYIREEGIV